MLEEMNNTDLRILNMMINHPWTSTGLAVKTGKEYTYIMQRLMILKAMGLVVVVSTCHYKTRRNLYVVPGNKKREALKLISFTTDERTLEARA